MTYRRVLVSAVAAALANVGLISLAQAQSEAHQPDAKHGAVIAAQGTAAGVPACDQCHSVSAGSDASSGSDASIASPRISGQSAYYLAKQMRDFSSGVRANDIMSAIATAMSPDDIADVAAYYASVKAPFPPLKAADPAMVKRGDQLATVGSAERRIQACNNCHGPGGAGEPPAIPYLAGQFASYIASALQEWQKGLRKSSIDSMGVVAKKLDDEQIDAVAAYYQQVQSSLEAVEVKGKD